MALRTDYKDDILSSGNLRKYQMINNGDGTVSFQDVTVYQQTGDTFGAGDINKTNQAVNEKFDSDDVVDPMETTKSGFAADALAVKNQFNEQNKKLNVRYNSETDKIEIYYNNAWVEWKTIGFKDPVALIPMMSSNNYNGIVLTASNTASGRDCYRACDGNASTHWQDSTNLTTNTAWFMVEFPEAKKVSKIACKCGNYNSNATVTLQGSNNGTTFTDLTDAIKIGDPIEFEKNVNSQESYKYYRLQFNNVTHNAGMGCAVAIWTLQLYGVD